MIAYSKKNFMVSVCDDRSKAGLDIHVLGIACIAALNIHNNCLYYLSVIQLLLQLFYTVVLFM